jgi:hypothetical protein
MARSLWLSILLGVGLLLGIAPSHAQTLRVPKVGNPALSVNVAAGWTSSYDQYGNLQIYSSDRSVNLQLSMVAAALGGAPTLNTLNDAAAGIFKTAGAQPYTRSEPSMLAGQLGMAYYGTLNSNNVVFNLKVVLAEVDSSHLACLTTITRQNATLAELASLDALVGTVQLSGAK